MQHAPAERALDPRDEELGSSIRFADDMVVQKPRANILLDPLRPLRSRKVAIVGFSETTRDQAPYNDPDVEIWLCNRLGVILEKEGKRWDRHFDPHPLEWSEKHHKPEDWTEYAAWLAKGHGDRLVYLPPSEFAPPTAGRVPNAVGYPLELVLDQVAGGRRYFTSAIAYQIGLALLLGAEWIGLYGIDLRDVSEYEFQRPCAEWLLGLAAGRGVEVYVPPESALLNADLRSPLYGMEVGQGLAGELEKVMDARAAEIEGEMAKLRAQNDKILELLHTWYGAQQETAGWAARIKQYRRGGKL